MQLDLIQPNLIGIEVIYNENLKILEQLSSRVVADFIKSPQDKHIEQLNIINNPQSEFHNSLVYYTTNWCFLTPRQDMILYVKSKQNFYIYDGEAWQVTHEQLYQNLIEDKIDDFISAEGDILIDKEAKKTCLYLNANCKIFIFEHELMETELIIKQNYVSQFTVTMADNILLQSETICPKANNIIAIKLHKLPERDHYSAEISAEYSY